MREKNYLFIVGTPRSGTTLVQSIIAANNEVISFPESHVFTLGNYKNIFKKTFWLKEKKLVKYMVDYHAHNYKGVPWISLFNKNKIYKEFKYSVDRMLLEQKKKAYLEKTPMHLHFINDITLTFDSPVFIHVIRDEYENVRSLYHATQAYSKEWSGKRSILKCVKRWEGDLSIHHEYLSKKNHFFVNYEDVISEDSDVLALGKFIFKKNFDRKNIDKILSPGELWKSNNRLEIGRKSSYQFLSRNEFKKLYHNEDIDQKYSDFLSI